MANAIREDSVSRIIKQNNKKAPTERIDRSTKTGNRKAPPLLGPGQNEKVAQDRAEPELARENKECFWATLEDRMGKVITDWFKMVLKNPDDLTGSEKAERAAKVQKALDALRASGSENAGDYFETAIECGQITGIIPEGLTLRLLIDKYGMPEEMLGQLMNLVSITENTPVGDIIEALKRFDELKKNVDVAEAERLKRGFPGESDASILEALEKLSRLGLDVTKVMDLKLGFPGESCATILEVLEKLPRLDVTWAVALKNLLPAKSLYEIAKALELTKRLKALELKEGFPQENYGEILKLLEVKPGLDVTEIMRIKEDSPGRKLDDIADESRLETRFPGEILSKALEALEVNPRLNIDDVMFLKNDGFSAKSLYEIAAALTLKRYFRKENDDEIFEVLEPNPKFDVTAAVDLKLAFPAKSLYEIATALQLKRYFRKENDDEIFEVLKAYPKLDVIDAIVLKNDLPAKSLYEIATALRLKESFPDEEYAEIFKVLEANPKFNVTEGVAYKNGFPAKELYEIAKFLEDMKKFKVHLLKENFPGESDARILEVLEANPKFDVIAAVDLMKEVDITLIKIVELLKVDPNLNVDKVVEFWKGLAVTELIRKGVQNGNITKPVPLRWPLKSVVEALKKHPDANVKKAVALEAKGDYASLDDVVDKLAQDRAKGWERVFSFGGGKSGW